MPAIRPIAHEQTYPLRHAVLWPDKPLDYVKVDNDAMGHHYGAFEDDELVAVISLFVDGEKARFRKFATRPDWQRRGVGTLLLTYVMQQARLCGARTIWCDARLDAAHFYRRFGMEAVSEVFFKGPIAYAQYAITL